jgi:sulfur-oxidizing protein SoxY
MRRYKKKVEITMDHDSKGATRRDMLLAGLGGLGAAVIKVEPAAATPESMRRAIHQVVGEAPVRKGKVTIDAPPLVENGNTVALAIDVESPMTQQDHVKAIHVFNEKNPQPNIANFYLGPHSGRAQVSTRIRLADSQKIVAIARLSDGSFWSASTEVIVTLAACTEEVI